MTLPGKAPPEANRCAPLRDGSEQTGSGFFLDNPAAKRIYEYMLTYKEKEKPVSSELCQCRIIHREKVQRAKDAGLPRGEVARLADFFKAFADPTRLKILWALAAEEMCVCDLAAFLGISESAVSHQLRMLRQLALVANRREGPVLHYHLTDAHVSQLVLVALEHIRE